jgi:hypothetical protein
MRAACECRASLFTDDIFESRLLATLNHLAVEMRIEARGVPRGVPHLAPAGCAAVGVPLV